jgi:hypothetical protein
MNPEAISYALRKKKTKYNEANYATELSYL